MLVDTHSHIYDPTFDADRPEVVSRCRGRGVKRILMPAIDKESYGALFSVYREYPGVCFPMMGLHSTSVNDNPHYKEDLRLVAEYLKNPPEGIVFYGVGETGLDLHWSRDYLKEQVEALRFQIELGLEYGLPVVMHTRDAWPQIRKVLDSYRGSGLKGVLHSFSGTPDDYIYIKECGNFLFGIGGPVTYKKSALTETVKAMDLRDIILETDSPYLPPAPHRGERNEPAHLIYICAKIAEITGLEPEKIAEITTVNAVAMFGL